MRARLRNTMVLGTIGVVVIVVAATSVGAALYASHHYERLLEAARRTATSQSEMIRIALEHQMAENDRSLLAHMIQRFASDPSIDGVMILDRHGQVGFSSHPPTRDQELAPTSPTCRACHDRPAGERDTSRVIEAHGGQVLRTVTPIRNEVACHGCHSPDHAVNGILVVDIDAGRIRAGIDADLGWMVAGTAVLALVILGGVGFIVRLVVLRRLQRFETTARQIAAGEFDRRIPVNGNDTLSWLAREFNTMADSVTTLLRGVREQREQLEAVINGIDDGIVVLSPDFRVVAANDSFLRRIGQRREAAVGAPCRSLTGDVCQHESCPAVLCLAAGTSHTNIVALHGEDEQRRYEEVRASTIRDAQGHPLYVVEVWRDITTRRTTEARMIESQRLAALGMLASGFSHELNTPLGTILVCLDSVVRCAERGETSPERLLQVAGIAREQVLRCRGITQQFLRLARGGRGSTEDALELGEAITSAQRLIAPTAAERGVELVAAHPETPVTVRASESHVQQVLMNLLINAIQACPRGGRVAVSIEVDQEVRVVVQDTGCGVRPTDRARIFDPFFSGREGGTGLGLFLSRDFAQGWGGDLRLANGDGGATFHLCFPARFVAHQEDAHA
ncbi:MAG: hypothetical protein AMXMBFR64_05970 [Myxococcales bacterium]